MKRRSEQRQPFGYSSGAVWQQLHSDGLIVHRNPGRWGHRIKGHGEVLLLTHTAFDDDAGDTGSQNSQGDEEGCEPFCRDRTPGSQDSQDSQEKKDHIREESAHTSTDNLPYSPPFVAEAVNFVNGAAQRGKVACEPVCTDVNFVNRNGSQVRIIPRQSKGLRNITTESRLAAIDAELARIAAEAEQEAPDVAD